MADSDDSKDGPGRERILSKDEVYEAFVDREQLVLATRDVADAIDAPYKTTENRLKELEDQGRVARQKVGNANAWYRPGERPVLADDTDDGEEEDDTIEAVAGQPVGLPGATVTIAVAATVGYGLLTLAQKGALVTFGLFFLTATLAVGGVSVWRRLRSAAGGPEAP